MSNFPIHHGITLAPNAFIENLQLEVFATDPSAPLVAGRVWFNSTEKSLKYTTLDANDNVIIVANVVSTDVATALQEAKDYTDTEISALVNSAPEILDTLKELADAINQDDDFSNTVLTNIANAKAEILGTVGASFDTLGEIETKLTQLDAADTVPGSVAYKLKAEQDRAEAAEELITDRLDVIEGADTVEGSVAKVAKAVVDETTARELAATTEHDARVAVEGSLASLTTDANTTLVGAINEVASELADEVTARELAVTDAIDTAAADATTKSDAALVDAESYADGIMVTEVAARELAATTEHDARVAVEGLLASLTTDAAGNLVAAINEVDAHANTVASDLSDEVTNRELAVTTLRDDINAGQYWEQTATAELEHTIAHGLGSTQTSFTVLVERATGGYRNDIVSVEEINSNTLKVYLSEAKRIKIFVQKFAAV